MQRPQCSILVRLRGWRKISEISFPISTAPGINPTESGGRLINCYVDPADPGARSKFIWRRAPGLKSVFSVGTGLFRGYLKLGSQLIVVNGDTAYSVVKSGGSYSTSPLTGIVGGEGPLIMARNMRATPQIMAISQDGTPFKIESGVVSAFSDPDLPVPNSVTFKDSYFIFGIGDGRAFQSGINNVTINSLDYTTAEALPDGLVRVVATQSDLLLMGESTIEFYADTAEPTGFAFSRGPVIPLGLYGRYAVAGSEEGFPGGIGFVASDGTVRLLSGYDPRRISTPDLERLIEGVDDPDDLRVFVFVASGHPFFAVTCASWTWVYDLSTGTWHERKSLDTDNWRIDGTVCIFDEWLAFDSSSNQVYRIDPNYASEGSRQLVMELSSGQQHGFPGRAVVNRASFDFMTGVGLATGSEPKTKPKVAISWSIDGGVTFGTPLFRELGPLGAIVPIDIRRLGLTGPWGIQYKLQIADPVPVAFFGAAQDVEARAA